MQHDSSEDKDTRSQPQRQRSSFLANKRSSVLLALAAAMLIVGISFSLNHPTTAKAATWTQIWSDEFNGAANTGVNTSNWLYDTGTGYGCSGCPGNWGTGEV